MSAASRLPSKLLVPHFLLLQSVLLTARALSTTTGRSTSSPWSDAATKAADMLRDAQSVLIVTGAGISAESGLPTYRGVSGLYNDGGSALQEDGMPIEECLSGSTYRRDPKLTWKYLLQIERACRGAQPSKAHKLVARVEKHIPRVAVMTQNVDGLHDRAGSKSVLSLHGNVHRLRCSKCDARQTVESYAHLEKEPLPPICDKCGGPTLRPEVVLFDEYLGDDTVQTYEEMMDASMMSLMYSWGEDDRTKEELPFDVSISIGTSAMFAYVNAAALSGRKTIEINPGQTSLSPMVDVQVPAGATETLEFIFKQLGWDIHET